MMPTFLHGKCGCSTAVLLAALVMSVSGCSLLGLGEGIEQPDPVPGTGDIYGQIVDDWEPLGVFGATVEVMERNASYPVGEEGIFLIPNLPPGKYDFVSHVPGYKTDVVKNVVVRPDTLTFVPWVKADRDYKPHPSTWKEGAQIPRVDLSKRGRMRGQVIEERPVESANVWIKGTFWRVATDENGHYSIEDILPGTYDVEAQIMGYCVPDPPRITVTPDSTLQVDVQLHNIQIC